MQVESISELNKQLMALQMAYSDQPYQDLQARIKLLKSLKKALVANKDELVMAANDDFNGRTEFDSVFGDIIPTVSALDYMCSNLKSWMKPQKRRTGIMLWPSKATVQYVPKGVVGVISPWNYPIQLALLPVATAFAAGNRVMLKLSEFTPKVNQVIKKLFAELTEHCVIVEGDHHVADAFSQLKFDHLFFTGATEIGKKVMAAAAKNLVPVTLELGGKSPVIVADDAHIKHTAKTILFGKLLNCGQICVAPDYVLVTKQQSESLIKELKAQYTANYPQQESDEKISSIINQKQFSRLQDILVDAKAKGATIWPSLPEQCPDQRMGLHLVINPSAAMEVMQNEIFGPILPIVVVDNVEEAIQYIELHERPLATYLFSDESSLIEKVSKTLRTGTLAINEVVMQVTVEDIPFGGVGYSGMGQYHGKEGFVSLSHAKSILHSDKKTRLRTHLMLKQSKILTHFVKKLMLK
ncbi:aldehyde dehydrogenase family protein [Pseudoalteromonas sp. JBTF-M23]|uniref:Aldehyde dehydrogenase n=1 Tax=Pseudoalteromonas caenipelagi TaxID=2726988 RepID=A0A849VBF4_9GAMM|nr:aldehyde dehydrogenase family protein [Pseudoalteromonas caenipelagi]NOU50110.1 aldehyde dehydrogenase family protein [Pseudoalteromonas caenipelagi]